MEIDFYIDFLCIISDVVCKKFKNEKLNVYEQQVLDMLEEYDFVYKELKKGN